MSEISLQANDSSFLQSIIWVRPRQLLKTFWEEENNINIINNKILRSSLRFPGKRSTCILACQFYAVRNDLSFVGSTAYGGEALGGL